MTAADAALEALRLTEPELRAVGEGHFVACHHPLIGGEAPVAVRPVDAA